MSEDLHPYNDFFKKKLENHESSVPDDLFDKIMGKRNGISPDADDAAYNGFFKKKLSDYESFVSGSLFDSLIRNREGSDEIPSDAPLRERILEHEVAVLNPSFETIIEERERRRRALVWRFATAMFLLLGAYLLFLSKNTPSKSLETKTNRSLQTDNEKMQASTELRPESDALTAMAEKLTDQTAIHPPQQDLLSKKDKTLIINSQQKNSSTQPTITDIKLPKSNNKFTSSEYFNNQNTVSNSTNFLTEHTAEQQTIIPTISTVSNSTTAAVLEPNNFTVENRGLEANSHSTSNSPLSTNVEPSLTLGTQNLIPSFEHLSSFKVKNIEIPSRAFKNPCADPGDGCPTFGRKRNRGGGEKSMYVDVYGAPEYAFRRLSENLPEMTTYLHARDTIESPWYAFSAGARASVVFENGLALRTGFAFAQTNEVAVFDSLGIGKRVTTETYLPRTGGGQDTIRKTEITSGIFRTTIYNRYRSIDIPLQLGFEFPINDYWSFSVNGGVNFNISAWRKADILGEKLSRQPASSRLGEANLVFRNSLGFSVFGSVAAYRQLTGNLQLVIEPSVRHYLQPITRSDYALKQAYTNAGLIVGLRLRL